MSGKFPFLYFNLVLHVIREKKKGKSENVFHFVSVNLFISFLCVSLISLFPPLSSVILKFFISEREKKTFGKVACGRGEVKPQSFHVCEMLCLDDEKVKEIKLLFTIGGLVLTGFPMSCNSMQGEKVFEEL
jgi:hypothetical protein